MNEFMQFGSQEKPKKHRHRRSKVQKLQEMRNEGEEFLKRPIKKSNNFDEQANEKNQQGIFHPGHQKYVNKIRYHHVQDSISSISDSQFDEDYRIQQMNKRKRKSDALQFQTKKEKYNPFNPIIPNFQNKNASSLKKVNNSNTQQRFLSEEYSSVSESVQVLEAVEKKNIFKDEIKQNEKNGTQIKKGFQRMFEKSPFQENMKKSDGLFSKMKQKENKSSKMINENLHDEQQYQKYKCVEQIYHEKESAENRDKSKKSEALSDQEENSVFNAFKNQKENNEFKNLAVHSNHYGGKNRENSKRGEDSSANLNQSQKKNNPSKGSGEKDKIRQENQVQVLHEYIKSKYKINEKEDLEIIKLLCKRGRKSQGDHENLAKFYQKAQLQRSLAEGKLPIWQIPQHPFHVESVRKPQKIAELLQQEVPNLPEKQQMEQQFPHQFAEKQLLMQNSSNAIEPEMKLSSQPSNLIEPQLLERNKPFEQIQVKLQIQEEEIQQQFEHNKLYIEQQSKPNVSEINMKELELQITEKIKREKVKKMQIHSQILNNSVMQVSPLRPEQIAMIRKWCRLQTLKTKHKIIESESESEEEQPEGGKAKKTKVRRARKIIWASSDSQSSSSDSHEKNKKKKKNYKRSKNREILIETEKSPKKKYKLIKM